MKDWQPEHFKPQLFRFKWSLKVGIGFAFLPSTNRFIVRMTQTRGEQERLDMKVNYRVSLEFVSYSDSELAQFAGNVVTSLTKNASFPNPPVPVADLGTLAGAFHSAVQAAMLGGIQLTAAKNTAREALLDALRKTASYVQSIANQDQQMLLSSGYFAGSTNRRRGQPIDWFDPVLEPAQPMG
jgi:hypothetical protein